MASSISHLYKKLDFNMKPVIYNNGLNYQENLKAGSIHSGHFMVSYVHDETDDLFDKKLNPWNDNNDNLKLQNSKMNNNINPSIDPIKILPLYGDAKKQPIIQNTIDSTLSVLLKHMSLAYSGKLTSPKWKHFKGIKVKLKDKIRLNNIIWREWYMQYIKKQNPVVCQFDVPVFEKIHSRPEAVVLEGKYWKRRLQCLTMEYKKWRMFFRQKNLSKNLNDTIFQLDKSTVGQSTDNLFTDFMDILMPSISESNIDDEQCLFSPFDCNPFPDSSNEYAPLPNFIPFSREISQLGLGDIIQPQLLQLQPSFDDINMEVDALSPLPNYNDFHSNFKYTMMTAPNQNLSQTKQDFLYENTIKNSLLNFSQGSSNYLTITNSLVSNNLCTPSNTTQIRSTGDPINLSQIRSSFASLNSPLNLVQKKGSEYFGSHLQQNNNEFKNKISTSQFQSDVCGRERTVSGGMQAPQDIIGGNNVLNTGDEPRRASTGSSPLYLNKFPKKRVSFVLPNNNNVNNDISIHPNYYSCQPDVVIGNQQLGNPSIRSQLKPVTRKNSNSILELLLSNDSWVKSSDLELSSQNFSTTDLEKSDSVLSFEDQFGFQFSKDVKPQIVSSHVQSPTTSLLQSPIFIGNVLSKQRVDDELKQNIKKIDSGSDKDSKRNYHTTAEHQRRCNIKQGFEMLNRIVPDLNKINGCKINKATTLIKTAECCRKMKIDRERMLELARETRQEINQLQEYIRQLQMKLPASGIRSFGSSHSIQLDQLFDQFVRERSSVNWKFWIFSLIIRSWFTSFNEMLSGTSGDEMFKRLFIWLHESCSLVNLRPEVLKTMTEISRVTSILTDPAKISREAAEATKITTNPRNALS